MRLVRLVIPFFLGRFVSYRLWSLSAAAVSQRFDFEDGEALSYSNFHFVLPQLALLKVEICEKFAAFSGPLSR